MMDSAYLPGKPPIVRMTSTHALHLPATRPAADAALMGALFVLAAVSCFAGLDATSKVISAMPVMMLVWFRYVTQAGVTALTQLPRRGRALLRTRHPGLHVLRGVLIMSTSVCSFLSLRYTPVGELTAIVMLTPLLMTLISALSSAERVSRVRWLLIGATFAGALLVVRPGANLLSPALLMPLVTLALNTGFHLVTSRLARLDDVGTMQLYTGCTGAVLATIALPFFWAPLGSWTTWALLGLVCLLSTAGHWMLIVGYAKAGVATLTPLLFAQIAVSTLLGWLVFAHVPDAWALAGICLIMLGGAACMALSARERGAAGGPAALENASMEH
jgi:drug/metabolite transporter (DMT)-like permease